MKEPLPHESYLPEYSSLVAILVLFFDVDVLITKIMYG